MRQPMLLRRGHRQRFAIIPFPAYRFRPLQPVRRNADVAITVFGANRQQVTIAEVSQLRLQQATLDRIVEFAAGLFDFDRPAVERTEQRRDAVIRPIFRPEADGDEQVSVFQNQILRRACRIDRAAARIVPFQLPALRPDAFCVTHEVDRIARRLFGKISAVAVIDDFAERDHPLRLRVILRNDIADGLFDVAVELAATETRNRARLAPRLPVVG
ncbi:MAG: hypothetical protein JMDDDDMK_01581 [Acidobacteria bacterium]|nr:hypothetical protein [Acidobacteriota bacterium]